MTDNEKKIIDKLIKDIKSLELAINSPTYPDTTIYKSDLDVLYDLKENKSMSFRDFIKLEETIVQLTGVKKVDLVRVQNINPFVWITVKKNVIYV